MRGGVAVLARAGVLDHAGQLHRLVFARRHRCGLAHGRGWVDFFRPSGIRWLGRLHLGLSHPQRGALALAHGVGWPGAHRGRGLCAGQHHAAHVGALPAPGHDRVGFESFLLLWQCTRLGQIRRFDRRTGLEPLWLDAQHRARLLRRVVGLGVVGSVGCTQPAGLAGRPGVAGSQGRQHFGRSLWCGHLAHQGDGIRARRMFSQRVGVALCAFSAHGQPVAVRSQYGHRVSVHGRGRRRGAGMGCRGRRGHRQAARRPTSNPVAAPAGWQRQL